MACEAVLVIAVNEIVRWSSVNLFLRQKIEWPYVVSFSTRITYICKRLERQDSHISGWRVKQCWAQE